MNINYTISLLLLLICSMGNTQIDTLAIHNQLNAFKSANDHKVFWKTIRNEDQHFRGSNTVDAIDFRNIIKASMYFNKFGYPTKQQAGKASSIISYVWIHNLIPKVDEITFCIILEGYLNKHFSESDFRNYYIRSIYKRKFNDKGYKTAPIKQILAKLELDIPQKINIEEIILEYTKGQDFLKRKHTEYGLWVTEPTYNTIYHNDNPIINKIEHDPIRIFIDENEDYYIQYLYNDGSYYPRKLIVINSNTFRLFKDSNSHYQVLKNGDLEYINEDGLSRIYTPHQQDDSAKSP